MQRLDRRILSLTKLRFWRRKRLDPLPVGEEREALQFERQFEEEQGSIRAIFKKMIGKTSTAHSGKTDDCRAVKRACRGRGQILIAGESLIRLDLRSRDAATILLGEEQESRRRLIEGHRLRICHRRRG